MLGFHKRLIKIDKKLRIVMNSKTKCIIISVISVFILILIIFKILFDESQIKESNSFKNVKFEQASDENKIKYQIDYLSQVKETSQSLLDRKENAVWAAFALYVTGLVFLFRRLEEYKKLECYKRILICFIIILIAISVFAFIHAQYSSIYDKKATIGASQALLLDIIENEKPIKNFQMTHENLYHSKLGIEQKFRGKLHPLRIVISFLCLDWTKSSNREMTTVNTQEASIYFLLFLFNIICIILLLKGNIKEKEKTN
jgi:hypothetical protein